MRILDAIKTVLGWVTNLFWARARSELVDRILGLQAAVQSLQEENRALKEQLRTLQDKRESIKHLTLKGNAYWKGDTAYCINCVQGGVPRTLTKGNNGTANCPHCRRNYLDVFERESPPTVAEDDLPPNYPYE